MRAGVVVCRYANAATQMPSATWYGALGSLGGSAGGIGVFACGSALLAEPLSACMMAWYSRHLSVAQAGGSLRSSTLCAYAQASPLRHFPGDCRKNRLHNEVLARAWLKRSGLVKCWVRALAKVQGKKNSETPT